MHENWGILREIRKYPSHNLVFDSCKIEDIKIALNKSAQFKNCEIANLKLDQNSICSSKFEGCVFKFDNSEQRIFCVLKGELHLIFYYLLF